MCGGFLNCYHKSHVKYSKSLFDLMEFHRTQRNEFTNGYTNAWLMYTHMYIYKQRANERTRLEKTDETWKRIKQKPNVRMDKRKYMIACTHQNQTKRIHFKSNDNRGQIAKKHIKLLLLEKSFSSTLIVVLWCEQ